MSVLQTMQRYVDGCLSGEIPVCEQIRFACERHNRDLTREDIYFDEAAAERVVKFIQLMKHVKGKWAGTNITLEPWQVFFVGSIFGWKWTATGLRRYREANLTVPRKNGKGLALDTPLPTPSGWKSMGEITCGDTLFDDQGNPCNVIFTSDIREIDCYEILFSNGEKIVCDGDHLWLTTARVDTPGSTKVYPRKKGVSKRVRNTRELFETQTYGKRGDRNHSLVLASPIQCQEKELPLDPYLLGVWLGDGHSGSAQISCGREDLEEMVNNLKVFEPELKLRKDRSCWRISLTKSRNAKNEETIQNKLRMLGLLNNKHIPKEYLRASFAQRLALLQGLMDTDGTCDRRGRSQSIVTGSKVLSEGIAELLASLGVKFSIKEESLRCNGRDVPGTGYLHQFCVNRERFPVFRLKRKEERQKFSEKISPRSTSLQIISVTKVPSVKTKCIQVDSPSKLFLCGKTMIPTHNTTFFECLDLYMLAADKEPGAEIILGASKEPQAKELFSIAQAMVRGNPDFMKTFKISMTTEVLRAPLTNSVYKYVIGKPADGGNSHAAHIEEAHEHKSSAAYDVLKNGMGAREQPLLYIASTAGSDIKGFYYQHLEYCRKVVAGTIEDDSLFSLEYTIDKDDSWEDFSVWRKANPNFGVSVFEDFLRGQYKKALDKVDSRTDILTKHLDVWNNSSTAWIDYRKWLLCGDDNLKIEDFKGQECWVGLDLASRVDLCSLMFVFKNGDDFAVFGKHYINSETANKPENQHYRTWKEEGWLTITEGAETDFTYIANDLKEMSQNFAIQELAYDPREASFLMQTVREWASFPCIEVSQGPVNFSEPMKVLEAAYLTQRLKHQNDHVLNWAASNVILKNSSNKLFYPAKRDRESKIDPAVALIMALARAEIANPPVDTSIFIL